MEFEWDDHKALANTYKHGVSFLEAITVWLDDNFLEIPDSEHSQYEERWVRLGFTRSGVLVIVVYTEKIENHRVRIISARKAMRSEIESYNLRRI